MAGRRATGSRAQRVTTLGSGSAPKHALEPRTAKNAPANVHPGLMALSEAQFQRIVRAHLARFGYVVWVFPIMKRTMAGVPDLTFWHPARPGVLHAWELKRERGRVRPEQAVAIAHLATVPGIDARIVRPSEWPDLRDGLLTAARDDGAHAGPAADGEGES